MNDQMKKTSLRIIIAVCAVLLFYNILLFVIAGFSDHYASFWISYIFTMIAFAAVFISSMLLSGRLRQPRDQVLGLPILKHCAIYIAVQLCASILFMALDKTGMPWEIAFVFQMIVLGLHLAMVASCFKSKEVITKLQEKVKTSTARAYWTTADAELLAGQLTDPTAKAAAEKLAEEIRYSDPVSNPALEPLEQQITQYIGLATSAMHRGDYAEVTHCCEQAMTVLTERNKKCLLLKRM